MRIKTCSENRNGGILPPSHGQRHDNCEETFQNRQVARRCLHIVFICLALLPTFVGTLPASAQTTKIEKPRRQIFVPFDSLNVLLDGNSNRVLMSREEYDELLEQAKIKKIQKAPLDSAVLSARYTGSIDDGIASITGELVVEPLNEGLVEIPLPFSGVAILDAKLDDQPANLWRKPDGQIVLLCRQIDPDSEPDQPAQPQTLTLSMQVPLQTTAARQSMSLQLPGPAATQFTLTVPGNVDVKSGASVIDRQFDEDSNKTRFELLPTNKPMNVVMSLNNRTLKDEQVIASSSVVFHKLAPEFQELHVTSSLEIIHGATEEIEYLVPAGYEVSEVATPLLSRWEMEAADEEGESARLIVRLRQPTRDPVVLNITAIRNESPIGEWQSSDIRPLDIAGHVSVVGTLIDDRLESSELQSEGVIPIDHAVILAALPATLRSEGQRPLSVVAAYYAPQSDYEISARLNAPDPELIVKSNSRLVVRGQELQVQTGIALISHHDSRFRFKLELPAHWRIDEITDVNNRPVRFDRITDNQDNDESTDASSRFLVHLSSPVGATAPTKIFFNASHTPDGWLQKWDKRDIEFPRLKIGDQTKHTGTVAVTTDEDLLLQPTAVEELELLDKADRKQFETGGVDVPLAYRFEGSNYRLAIELQRKQPLVTSRAYNFFTIQPTRVVVRAELIYQIKQAAEDKFQFELPIDSPQSIAIRSHRHRMKNLHSTDTEDARIWTVQIAEPTTGEVHLLIDYQFPLEESELDNISLQPVTAENVQFQSSLVALEGSTELDIETNIATKSNGGILPPTDTTESNGDSLSPTTSINAASRPVDIGEFAAAVYQPGRRLLAAWAWPSETVPLTLSAKRRPIYPLPAAIVQRAEMVTSVSNQNTALTAARFQLAVKQQPFLRIELPDQSTLWSVRLDGKSAKPQRSGDKLLVSLVDQQSTGLRDLQLVYESSAKPFQFVGQMESTAPRLWLTNADQADALPVPLVDLHWELRLPDGFAVASTDGNFQSSQTVVPITPIQQLGKWFYALGGGIGQWSVGLQQSARLRAPASESGEADYIADGEMFIYDDSGSTSQPSQMVLDELMGETEEESELLGGQGFDERRKLSLFGRRGPEDAPSRTAPGKPADQTVSGSGKDEAGKSMAWAFSGLRSLNIELADTGHSVEFYNLGEHPTLNAKLVNQTRLNWLALAVALIVALIGILYTHRQPKSKFAYLVGVALIASLIPVIGFGLASWRTVVDMVLLAVVLVAIYFIVAALFRILVQSLAHLFTRRWFLALLLTFSFASLAGENVSAQKVVNDANELRRLIAELQADTPAPLPGDALIIPYDVDDPEGREKAEKLLLPYEHYLALIQQARQGSEKVPADLPTEYVVSSASYDLDLDLENDIVIRGTLVVDVLTDEPVAVTLPLHGGVLAEATVDGQPAKLRFAPVSQRNNQARRQQQKSMPHRDESGGLANLIQLHLEGAGSKTLKITVRAKPQRQGGWRVLDLRVPVGMTRGLNLRAKTEPTEVRIQTKVHQKTIQLEPDEQLASFLNPDGSIRLQWKPTTEKQSIDQSLTARSEALFDIREDGLRLNWLVDLDFRGSERDMFSLKIPAEFLVERVRGENIRSWEVTDAENADQPFQKLKVTLLAPAKDRETFSIELSQRDFRVTENPVELTAPWLEVDGAALHQGQYLIRQSPIVELKTNQLSAASRIDQPNKKSALDMDRIDAMSSPLGIEPFQRFQFITAPFKIGLTASLVPETFSATTESIYRLGQTEAKLESRINIEVGDRPLHELRLKLPSDLKINRLTAGMNETWNETESENWKTVRFFFPAGVVDDFSILLESDLTDYDGGQNWTLPSFEVVDADEQINEIAIQSDPALRVSIKELENCEKVLLSRIESWLNREQRTQTSLALRAAGTDYSAEIQIKKIPPRVSVESVTNVRTTRFAIEETILLDFDIRDAGIRRIQFEIPDRMEDARIVAKLVREISKQPSEDEDWVRVTLELQDEVIDSYRIVIENDRALSSGEQPVPVAQVLTGKTENRFVTLQNAGRDEIQVLPSDDFTRLNRQLKQFAALQQKLAGGELTLAYVANSTDVHPELSFEMQQRQQVETVAASIEFAKTTMVVDSAGAYRALQHFQINNRSEQYLEIELPLGARLLTVVVDGQPVKPVAWPTAGNDRQLRIPLVKTQAGDLDYPVQLKYGGRLGRLSNLGEIDFPIVETLNINVQLSQLHLRLPESHRWVNFDGTMTQVNDQGALAESFLSYKSRQIQQLAEQIQSEANTLGSSYSKKRAFGNLKKLEMEMEKEIQDQSRFRERFSQEQNAEVQELIDSNKRSIESAQEGYLQQESKQTGMKIDNRANLNEFVEQQSARISKNDITRPDNQNFDYKQLPQHAQKENQPAPLNGQLPSANVAPSQVTGGQKRKQSFDGQWLRRNQLDTDQAQQNYSNFSEVPQSSIPNLPDNQPNRPVLVPQPQPPALQRPQSTFDADISFANPPSGQSELQTKSEEREWEDKAQRDSEEMGFGDGPFGRLSDDPFGGQRGGGLGGGGWGGDAATPDESEPFSGDEQSAGQDEIQTVSLTSLEIQLPSRGVDYFFKSPRGNATVTARPVDRTSIANWTSVLWTLAVVLVVSLLVWLFAKLRDRKVIGGLAIVGLLLVGLMSLATAFLPIYGLLAVVASLTLILRWLVGAEPEREVIA